MAKTKGGQFSTVPITNLNPEILLVGPEGPPGPAGSLTWINYVINWSAEPINLGAVTGGEKFQYTYPNGTLYRFVPSPYDPTQDALYTDTDLTDLVISRGGDI